MKKPEAMMFYPEAWKGSPSVAAMGPIARSGYFELLCAMWLSGGSLPNDERILQANSRLTPKEWKDCASLIRAELEIASDGRLTQRRLIEEYNRTVELQERKRRGGADGARRRWQKHGTPNGIPTGTANGSANANPMQTKTQTETQTIQQQQAAAGPAAAGSPEILDAVQLAFPTAKAGEKWEQELAGVKPAEYGQVAALIRGSPDIRAKTPVILVREAVAEVRAMRGSR